MLHYRVDEVLSREHLARKFVNKFFTYGASAHRLGSSTYFEVLIPIKRPERRHALLRQLQRESLGEQFELVSVYSFDGGPQYRPVDESDLDERGRLIESVDTEVVEDSEFNYSEA